jgi:hypothetical protein
MMFLMRANGINAQPRISGEPPEPAGPFRCQTCDALLVFVDTVTGGVSPVEHWDRYSCRKCGTMFEYRRRTRRLRRTT